MKKVIRIVLCLLLACMVLPIAHLTAEAAGSAHMSLRSSSGTLYRNDSFSLTVSLSNDQPVSNGGVILSYDSSVFEIVGGSCHVSNAALSEVSASRNGGVFVLQTDAVVSGTVFTINMRVKASAPFGTHSISGSPSLGGAACGFSGTNITVACKHTYGSASKVDGTNHQSTCTVCGEISTTAHTWDNGTVVSAATCKSTGTKRLTCTACGATKDETIPVSSEHKYSSWSKTSDTKHSHTCSVCGKQEAASHTWNSGTVLEKATCQKTGQRKRTCTGCAFTKTETIPIADHRYEKCVLISDAQHKSTCADCGKELTEDHRYGDSWVHDENWHCRRCAGCGNEIQQASHTPGPKATETTDQVCTVCNRILRPKGAHVHSFSEEWATDETGHWHACGDCNEKDSAAPHVFDGICDADCAVCGMIRVPDHVLGKEWFSDESDHWYICSDCGEKVGLTAHTPGPEATVTSPQTCTDCGYKIAPALPHEHIFDAQGTRHSHTCACGEVYEAEAGSCKVCAGFPWWILCIAEALVILGILGGGYFWLKKRGFLPALKEAFGAKH